MSESIEKSRVFSKGMTRKPIKKPPDLDIIEVAGRHDLPS